MLLECYVDCYSGELELHSIGGSNGRMPASQKQQTLHCSARANSISPHDCQQQQQPADALCCGVGQHLCASVASGSSGSPSTRTRAAMLGSKTPGTLTVRASPGSLPDVRCTAAVVMDQQRREIGWGSHPAFTDAAFQLGAASGDVGSRGSERTGRTRVIAGIGAYLAVEPRAQTSSWAVSDCVAAHGNAAHSSHWLLEAARPCMCIRDMEARAIALDAPHPEVAMEGRANDRLVDRSELVYELEWQSAVVHADAHATASCYPPASLASAGLVCQLPGFAPSPSTGCFALGSTEALGPAGATAAACMRIVECLQTAPAAGPRASLVLLDTGGAPGTRPPAGSNATALSSAAAASAGSLLRVAATEFPSAQWSILHLPQAFSDSEPPTSCSDISLRLQPEQLAADGGTADMYGRALCGGVWSAPHLLARKPAALGMASPRAASHLHGSVVVTGGLGALGSIVACWLAGWSSCDLWLLGRSGRTGGEPLPSQLYASNGSVICTKGDVAAAEEAACVMEAAGVSSQLQSIMHAGAALDSQLFVNISAGSLRTEFSGKVHGGEQLLAASSTAPLSAVQLFSSLSAFSGGGGQATYAAANSALDAWACAAQGAGRPILSVQWGNWGGGGMAVRNRVYMERMERMGFALLDPALGLAVMSGLLHELARETNIWSFTRGVVMANRFLWANLARSLPAIPPVLEDLARQPLRALGQAKAGPPAPGLQIGRRRRCLVTKDAGAAATSGSSRQEEDSVLPAILSALSALGAAAVAQDQPFMDAGLDSMGMVQLRNELMDTFRVDLPSTATFDHPTPAALARFIAQRLADARNVPPPALESGYASEGSTIEPAGSVTEVVGLSCTFPGAAMSKSVTGFWQTALASADLPTVIPHARWDVERHYSPAAAASGKMAVRFGAFLAAVDFFDAALFRLAPGEAAAMDPQGRVLLEQAHLALTDAAGRLGRRVGHDTGVYVGVMHIEFVQYLASLGTRLTPPVVTGSGMEYLAGRLSYSFDLAGPCLAVHTACSSSLVATHLAHAGLLTGEVSYAAAAGVQLVMLPGTMSAISALSALSPVGRCKMFDASGDGYGRGDGCAVAVLRCCTEERPPAAKTSMAVLRATIVNQDGRSSSMTAPSGPAQSALVSAALARAAAAPEEVSSVAVHGTGTPLGDPIETGALGAALGSPGTTRQHLRAVALVSAKSCYRHTEGAAGLTGLLLATQVVGHKAVPPVMHLRATNPHVESSFADWQKTYGLAASVPRAAAPSPSDGTVEAPCQLAGTSSFGMSGVNAHALLLLDGPKSSQDYAAGLALLRREMHWPLPRALHLAPLAAPTSGGRRCSMLLDLRTPALAFLHDCQVAGRIALPSTALLEACLAAATVLLDGQPPSPAGALQPAATHVAALAGVTVPGHPVTVHAASQALVLEAVADTEAHGAAAIRQWSAAGSGAELLCSGYFVRVCKCAADARGSSTSSTGSTGRCLLVPTQHASTPPCISSSELELPGGICVSGFLLPPSACETALALHAAYQGHAAIGSMSACELCMPVSRLDAPNGRRQQLALHAGVQRSSVLAYHGMSGDGLMRMSGLRLTSLPVNKCSYVLDWRRMPVEHEDMREVVWLLLSSQDCSLGSLCDVSLGAGGVGSVSARYDLMPRVSSVTEQQQPRQKLTLAPTPSSWPAVSITCTRCCVQQKQIIYSLCSPSCPRMMT